MRTEAITYKDGDLTCHGHLALPDGGGKRPAVLVVHEAWGLDTHPRKRAEMLAELGYVALAVDMYGDGRTADDLPAAMGLIGDMRTDPIKLRKRANAGLSTLLARPEVDDAKVAAIGFCFGGMTALELARSGAPLAGVVSFHGALATAAPAEEGKVAARVLVLHGNDDPLIPAEQVQAFQQEMTKAKANWQFHTFGGVGHSFAVPGSEARGIPGVFYDAEADRRGWAAMRTFFDEIFTLA